MTLPRNAAASASTAAVSMPMSAPLSRGPLSPTERGRRQGRRRQEGPRKSGDYTRLLQPALVAQWIRASDYGSEGWGFESLRARRTRWSAAVHFERAVVRALLSSRICVQAAG